MGCYINPANVTKEAWLRANAVEVSLTEAQASAFGDTLPICLVDNGPFTAAGVAFDSRELSSFAREDGRPKRWFTASREALRGVSDLTHYE